MISEVDSPKTEAVPRSQPECLDPTCNTFEPYHKDIIVRADPGSEFVVANTLANQMEKVGAK